MKPLVMALLNPCLLVFSTSLFAQASIDESNSTIEFGCQFHANDYFAEPPQSDRLPSSSDYLSLMSEAQVLEEQLVRMENSNQLWSEERANVLIGLARVKQAIGDTSEARELYEDALYNMRINGGVYTLEQLPVILSLMERYMPVDDEFTDQLGDRAIFLYEKAYTEDEQIPELLKGYTYLLELRRNAHYSFDRRRSVHLDKAAELEIKIESLMVRLVDLADPSVLDKLGGDPTFYTRYDDFGQNVAAPEAGVDQVSSSTGVILADVQELLRPSSPGKPVDYEGARQLLDELSTSYDTLLPVDQAALLDFYADYFLGQGNIPETISSFEKILAIPVLRPDYQLRALRALGQLYEGEQRWSDSIETFNCWRQLSTKEDARVFIGLANGYWKQGEIPLAIHFLRKHIETLDNDGLIAEESVYAVLRELYREIEDMDAVSEISQLMSDLFK